jgi:hypothetical protein
MERPSNEAGRILVVVWQYVAPHLTHPLCALRSNWFPSFASCVALLRVVTHSLHVALCEGKVGRAVLARLAFSCCSLLAVATCGECHMQRPILTYRSLPRYSPRRLVFVFARVPSLSRRLPNHVLFLLPCSARAPSPSYRVGAVGKPSVCVVWGRSITESSEGEREICKCACFLSALQGPPPRPRRLCLSGVRTRVFDAEPRCPTSHARARVASGQRARGNMGGLAQVISCLDVLRCQQCSQWVWTLRALLFLLPSSLSSCCCGATPCSIVIPTTRTDPPPPSPYRSHCRKPVARRWRTDPAVSHVR